MSLQTNILRVMFALSLLTYHVSDTLICPEAISVLRPANPRFIYLVCDVRLGRLRVSSTEASSHGVADGVSYCGAHCHSGGGSRHLGEHTGLSGCCSWSAHSRRRSVRWSWGIGGRRCPGHRWWGRWCPAVKIKTF